MTTSIHDDYIADLIRLTDNLEANTPITITVETPEGTVRVPCMASDLSEWVWDVLA